MSKATKPGRRPTPARLRTMINRFTEASERKQQVTVLFTALPGEVQGTAAHVRELTSGKCLAVRAPGQVTFVPVDTLIEVKACN